MFTLAAGFTVPAVRHSPAGVRVPAVTMLDIPRVTLPEPVAAQLAEFDLKNPNQLSAADYNSYSAAAIGGTLAIFLPSALAIFDVSGAVIDFILSALLGGGLGAFLALRSDGAGDAANKFGKAIVDAVGVDIPRVTLPDAATSTLKDIDLKNPNTLSAADYNSYSAAAIGGTLILFLPLALVFDVTGAVFDFIFSALLGGGLGAFLALRSDGAGDAANKFGKALLDAVDKVA